MIKICGIKGQGQLQEIDDRFNPDLVGLIFYKNSPRYVGNKPFRASIKARKVGVFVNSGMDEILRTRDKWGLDFAQLHGSESPEFANKLQSDGLKVIKAFSITDKLPLHISDYEESCDFLLMDSKSKQYGGSGKKFKWALMKEYQAKTPWFLSGGISPEDIQILNELKFPRMVGIDVNSGFETSPGIKDFSKLEKLKNYNG